MKFFCAIIALIICQFFLNQIIIDARPAKVKKFSWTFPIHDNEEDDTVQQLAKRKQGAGWGKRNDLLTDDHPYASHKNSAPIWFDDK